MKKPSDYKKHIVAFLDILGFKQIVMSDNYNALFSDYFPVINQISSWDTALFKMKGIKTAVLSDSLIFSIPFQEKAALEKILRVMVAAHRPLVQHKILTRGAIAVGDLYHENNVVFGPGLVEAYLLQEHSAIYPRCILRPETLRECLKTCSSNVGRAVTMQHFSLDEDGFWFFDVMLSDLKAQMYGDGKRGTDTAVNSIGIYRELIVENLAAAHSPRVLAKYEWLKGRYNHALEAIGQDSDYEVDLSGMMIETAPIIGEDGSLP